MYRCRAGSVLGVAVNVVCLLSVIIQPYMPGTSEEIQGQLQVVYNSCLLVSNSTNNAIEIA